jgi:phage terminase small subunit
MPRKIKKPNDKPLTAQQVRFCERYAEHGNATLAFREAGLTAKTEVAARRAASWLLAKRNIERHIDELRRELLAAARTAFHQRLEQDNPGYVSPYLTKDKER